MNKPRKRKNKILMINAVNEVTRERAQSFLTAVHIERVVDAYVNGREIGGFARLVPLEEIRGQSHNLSIPLYVRVNAASRETIDETIRIQHTLREWIDSASQLRISMTEMIGTLEESGCGN